MRSVYIGAVLTCIGLTSSCASNQEMAERAEFKTRITSSGLKHFQLSLAPRRAMMQPDMPNTLPDRDRQQRPRRRGGKAQEKQLIAILESKLLENQFCREGHWILDKSFIPANTFIRGECNESATEADRSNFPDTITRW